jgi:hypothetical protein
MQVYFSRHWWQVSRDFISYMSRLSVTKGGKIHCTALRFCSAAPHGMTFICGVAMILIVTIHLLCHWDWVVMMSKKIWNQIRSGKSNMSRGAKNNLAVNLVIATSFLLVAVSGVYFLFGPTGGYDGGANANWDIGFLFSRTTWDLIHTWSGVALFIAASFHFLIHWKWIKKVTNRFFQSQKPAVRHGA